MKRNAAAVTHTQEMNTRTDTYGLTLISTLAKVETMASDTENGRTMDSHTRQEMLGKLDKSTISTYMGTTTAQEVPAIVPAMKDRAQRNTSYCPRNAAQQSADKLGGRCQRDPVQLIGDQIHNWTPLLNIKACT